MMQVKQVVKNDLINKSFNPVLVQKIEANAVKSTEIKPVELSKAQSFNRLLEAYGDCV